MNCRRCSLNRSVDFLILRKPFCRLLSLKVFVWMKRCYDKCYYFFHFCHLYCIWIEVEIFDVFYFERKSITRVYWNKIKGRMLLKLIKQRRSLVIHLNISECRKRMGLLLRWWLGWPSDRSGIIFLGSDPKSDE